jgi:L-alanine-DL-glutamate epimerase-like enolase superfamily enzyme
MLPIDELIAQTDQNIADGFRAKKMKIGRGPGRGCGPGGRHARTSGRRLPLMADANMRWSRDEA